VGLSIRRQPQLHSRADDGVSFGELRGLADALPLLRSVIETRKDQIAAQSYAIRPRDRKDSPATAQAIEAVTRLLARPDRRHSFADWLRMLIEDMLVIDAATLYPRYRADRAHRQHCAEARRRDARLLQADRGPPAAAEGSARRVAGAPNLPRGGRQPQQFRVWNKKRTFP
jgi:hypothetical protein